MARVFKRLIVWGYRVGVLTHEDVARLFKRFPALRGS